MNCCDEYGDCRQGRDCPARKGMSSRVTHSTGFDYAVYIAYGTVIVFMLFLVVFVVYMFSEGIKA